ncbi:hypothetical protein HGRIS_011742 [Hohenbuehelia grisea]|uniref:Uncharacterized protein n=1 Tax=Hohenbuehelia grisea TaxID=104357 RepID=A0ABR3JXS2_9AGAR
MTSSPGFLSSHRKYASSSQRTMTTPSPSLTSFKTIVFDVYGTLVDWETPIYEGLLPIIKKYPTSASWTRKQVLEAYDSVEADIEAQHPDWLYTDVLAKVHEEMDTRLRAGTLHARAPQAESSAGVPSAPTADAASTSAGSSQSADATSETDNPHTAFAQSIRRWPIFPDTIAALRVLAKHYKLVVLSNVDHESFAHTHARLAEDTDSISSYVFQPEAGITSTSDALDPKRFFHPRQNASTKSPFTLVLTAQDTGAYKPAPQGLQTVLHCVASDPAFQGDAQSVGVEVAKGEVLVVAQSLFHDIYPAHRLGLSGAWIDRQAACMGMNVGETAAQRSELGRGKWTWRFETLGGLAAEVEKAFAGQA